MHRVGKSATETEAETWESDLISLCSWACMTGCFGRSHVYIIFRPSVSYMLAPPGSTSPCTSQGHSCANKALRIDTSELLRMPPGQTGVDALLHSEPAVLRRLLLSSFSFIWNPSCDPTGSGKAFITRHECCWLHVYPAITTLGRHTDTMGVGYQHAYFFFSFNQIHCLITCLHLKL